MRDLETISLAVSAAETGHLVFGTLHTSSAPQTVDRIIDVFPPHQQSQIRTQLSESLQGVIAQTLMPKIGGGRIAALEIMVSTPAVKNLIREGKTFQLPSVIETNTNLGMQTLGQALLALLNAGKITPETAIAKGLDPKLAGDMRLGNPTMMTANPNSPAQLPRRSPSNLPPPSRRPTTWTTSPRSSPASPSGAETQKTTKRGDVRYGRPGFRASQADDGSLRQLDQPGRIRKSINLRDVRLVVGRGRDGRLHHAGNFARRDGQGQVAVPVVDAADQGGLGVGSVVADVGVHAVQVGVAAHARHEERASARRRPRSAARCAGSCGRGPSAPGSAPAASR